MKFCILRTSYVHYIRDRDSTVVVLVVHCSRKLGV